MLMPFWYVVWDSGRSLISKHLLKNGDRCRMLVHPPTMVTNHHLVSDWCSSYPLQIINPTINRPLKILSSCTIHVISMLDQCQCWIPIWIDHFPTIFHENPVRFFPGCTAPEGVRPRPLLFARSIQRSPPGAMNAQPVDQIPQFPWLSECECQPRKICSKQKSKTYTFQHRPDWIPAYPAGQRVFYFSVSLRAGHSTWTRTWGALGIAKSTKSRLS